MASRISHYGFQAQITRRERLTARHQNQRHHRVRKEKGHENQLPATFAKIGSSTVDHLRNFFARLRIPLNPSNSALLEF